MLQVGAVGMVVMRRQFLRKVQRLVVGALLQSTGSMCAAVSGEGYPHRSKVKGQRSGDGDMSNRGQLPKTTTVMKKPVSQHNRRVVVVTVSSSSLISGGMPRGGDVDFLWREAGFPPVRPVMLGPRRDPRAAFTLWMETSMWPSASLYFFTRTANNSRLKLGTQRTHVPRDVVAPAHGLNPVDGAGVDPHQVPGPLDEAVHRDVCFVEVLQHRPPGPGQVVHPMPEHIGGTHM
ncbi:hypothetical protein EYF80_039292 [Liparis tanakae]|uniref:Uncharacterized protein n=1 Tax=Liparis tanakae TaxID=230148 RepID=A0A4Z2GCV9_9TELE|nr:hypothetical protein EYF80_039292 [Liparis tanakae]